MQRILRRVAFSEDLLGGRGNKEINEALRLLPMRRTLNEHGDIRHERCAERIGALLIGNHDGDPLLLSDGDDGIVFVQDADVHSAVRHAILHVGIACRDHRAVVLQPAQEVARLVVSPLHKQRGHLKRRRPEVGAGNCKTPFPARLRHIQNRPRRLGRLDLVGVVEDHPDSRREAGPHAVRAPVAGRNRGRCLRHVRRSEPLIHERDRAARVGRPEHVGSRSRFLRHEARREPGRLRFFSVVQGKDLHAGLRFVCVENQFREFLVGRAVHDDAGCGFSAAGRRRVALSSPAGNARDEDREPACTRPLCRS